MQVASFDWTIHRPSFEIHCQLNTQVNTGHGVYTTHSSILVEMPQYIISYNQLGSDEVQRWYMNLKALYLTNNSIKLIHYSQWQTMKSSEQILGSRAATRLQMISIHVCT